VNNYPGLFLISLDFELLWGVRDKRTIESYGENIRGVRKVIPALLQQFQQYDIHATFATVGFLFAHSKEELLQFVPSSKPNYRQKKFSPYENNYLHAIGQLEEEDCYHYGASLLKMIKETPNQEVATHTFSHYYCLEGASIQSFEEDLQSAIAIAARHAIELRSIVFPRNQYSNEHLAVCKKMGLTSYRGNEQSFIYRPRNEEKLSKFIKGLKFLDTYLNLSGHHTFPLSADSDGLLNLPASRFLRPYSNRLQAFNGLRLRRIKNGLTQAARNNQCFHLWWHPHNFGVNLKENLASLEEILKHFQKLQRQYGMQSKNMREIADAIRNWDYAN
jgi:hypothetical protein